MDQIRNLFNTSLDSVRRYSAFLEEAQIIFFLNKFSFKLGEQKRSNRKGYVIDTGLRNVISFRFAQDIGKLVENAIACHLKESASELFYFGNGSECDFIVKQHGGFIPIQVCYGDLSDEKIKNREYSGLIAAMNHLGQKESVLFTDDLEHDEQINGFTIRLKPVWKFLLMKIQV